MNEKIKELAKESGIASFLLNGTVVSPWVEDTDIGDYVENFAELIVKECLNIVDEVCDSSNNPEWRILEHFGMDHEWRNNERKDML